MVKIGLLWHSANSENLGVGALTVSNIAIVEKVAADLKIDVSFVILCWRDSGPMQIVQDNVSVFQMRARDLIRPTGLYREIRKCDLVLDISAGDSFADIYGSRRFVFNTISKLMVFAARKPLVMSPQTIGPFKQRWAETIARYLMRWSDTVVTRDGLSTEYVKRFGLKNVVEATDVAFRLPYDLRVTKKNTKKAIGINVSGWLFVDGQKEDNMVRLKSDYAPFVRKLINHFLARKDCTVHLVSHVIGNSAQDDYRVAEQLSREFPEVVLAPRFGTPSEAKSYISKLEYFCGSRMHACIAAFSSGVPVIPIAYSRKFAGLFGSLGYNESTDLQTQTGDEILEKVVAGFGELEDLKAKVATGQNNAVAKLARYEDVLARVMRHASCEDGKSSVKKPTLFHCSRLQP